jgi:diacylglycerol kinase (ATP)
MRAFTALVNPISGGGVAERRFAPVAARLRAAGAQVRWIRTRSARHAAVAAAEAGARGDTVIAVGGDGLIRDVVRPVVEHDTVLGIVPAGRGNDLVRTLGIPHEPSALAELLLSGRPRPVDLLGCAGPDGRESHLVAGNVYAGIDALAAELINANRWLPGPLLYRLAPLGAILRWRAVDYRLVIDGEPLAVRGHTVVIANSGAYGHGLRIVPPARLDDGVLHVLVVGDLPRRGVVGFLRAARTGAHLGRDGVQVRTGREVRIDAPAGLAVGADGDRFLPLPLTVRVRPGALRLLAPVS